MHHGVRQHLAAGDRDRCTSHDVRPHVHDADASDGTKQLVVNGHPLYAYSGDTKAGDENGQGIAGKWYYVSDKGEPTKGS